MSYIKIEAKKGAILFLGYEGENDVRQVVFDISDWVRDLGPGIAQLTNQRMGDTEPYLCPVEQIGDMVYWTITNAETAHPGKYGKCELSYIPAESRLVKSRVWTTVVTDALGEPTEEPPEAMRGYMEQIMDAGASALASAQHAKTSEDSAKSSEVAAAKSAEEAKQAASQGGNGGAPADWLAAEGEKGHVLNRTHYKVVKMEPFTVDSFQLTAEDNDIYDLSAAAGGDFVIYKMTDTVFTKEQLDGATVTVKGPSRCGRGSVGYSEEGTQQLSALAGGVVENYHWDASSESSAVDFVWGSILVAPNDLEVPGFGTIKSGSYIQANYGGIGSIFSNRTWTFKNEIITPLDSAFIPDPEVHQFMVVRGNNDTYLVPVTVGTPVEHTLNPELAAHIKKGKPVSITLYINEMYENGFLLHFPIREPNEVYKEQVIYSEERGELGVLFVEFSVSYTSLTITVSNFADKLGLS